MRSAALFVLTVTAAEFCRLAVRGEVYGVDLGWDHSVVASPRRDGIEVLWNEDTGKMIPSLMAFHGTRRVFGDLVDEMGASMRRGARAFRVKDLLFDHVEDVQNALLGLRVEHVVGMFIGHLLTQSCTQTDEDCVCVCVPALSPLAYKCRLLNACQTQGITHPIIVNEGTALALSYGFFQSDEARVMFVDVGQQLLQVTVASVQPDSVSILSHANTRLVCGATFDEVLIECLNEAMARLGLASATEPNPSMDLRSTQGRQDGRMPRLLKQVKEALDTHKYIILQKSDRLDAIRAPPDVANTTTNNTDSHVILERDRVDQLCAQRMLEPLRTVVAGALRKASLTADQIALVEIVGGGSLIHSIRVLLDEVIGVEKTRRTISPMFSVARGAAVFAAMHAPNFKVRPFEVKDVLTEDVTVYWRADGADYSNATHEVLAEASAHVHGTSGCILVNAGTQLPSTLHIHIHANRTLDICVCAGDTQLAEYKTSSREESHTDIVGLEMSFKVHGVPAVAAVSSWPQGSLEACEWSIDASKVGSMSSEEMNVCVGLEQSLRRTEKQREVVLKGLLWATSFMDRLMNDITQGELQGFLTEEEAQDVTQFLTSATNKLEQEDVTMDEVEKVAQEVVALRADVENKRTQVLSIRSYVSQIVHMANELEAQEGVSKQSARNKRTWEQLLTWVRTAEAELANTPRTKPLSITPYEIQRKMKVLQNLYDAVDATLDP